MTKEKVEELYKATDKAYFDASVIEVGQYIPRTHELEFHNRISLKGLRLSLLACICKKRDALKAGEAELYEALVEIQGLIECEMVKRQNNSPYFLRKTAPSCKHKSQWKKEF